MNLFSIIASWNGFYLAVALGLLVLVMLGLTLREVWEFRKSLKERRQSYLLSEGESYRYGLEMVGLLKGAADSIAIEVDQQWFRTTKILTEFERAFLLSSCVYREPFGSEFYIREVTFTSGCAKILMQRAGQENYLLAK